MSRDAVSRVPGTIRPARPDDVPHILRLIHDLAVYEREPDAVKNTPEALTWHLFGEHPAVFCHVVEEGGGEGGEATVVGLALWFLNYSTWEGTHGIWLEDLYVDPAARGRGHGKALLLHLASLAAERGYARMEWTVLDWNEPSIGFYRALGAAPLDEWTTYRLSGEALRRAAQSGPAQDDAAPDPGSVR
ncbi:GNAT family N-acetyltransferase [Citricoccus sp. NPDC055426]|uniref:GNAT family N-acetyltransferase n=1 Tax=Citricoccus sp. NPDC055426 TaxID=3155536 RepID=UPI00343E1881